MSSVDKALQTHIANIEAKTGKTMAELARHVAESPLTKHGELRSMIQETFGIGYGDANTVVHLAKQMATAGDEAPSDDELLDAIYAGKKADLRPLHDAVMQAIAALGPFEIAPKKTYLSLRRAKQFATVGPGSKGRVEIGLNMKDVEGTDRLEALPPGRMCQYRVYLSSPAEVDDALMGWIGTAYASAG